MLNTFYLLSVLQSILQRASKVPDRSNSNAAPIHITPALPILADKWVWPLTDHNQSATLEALHKLPGTSELI